MKCGIDEMVPAAVSALLAGRHWAPAEQRALRNDILERTRERWRELLSDALTIEQVAERLGVSNERVHDLVESGTLLAVMHDDELRVPDWQFDPNGEKDVVAGLPVVIRELDVSPLSKVHWLTRVNPMLGGLTPLECVKAGEVERVVGLARAVGFN